MFFDFFLFAVVFGDAPFSRPSYPRGERSSLHQDAQDAPGRTRRLLAPFTSSKEVRNEVKEVGTSFEGAIDDVKEVTEASTEVRKTSTGARTELTEARNEVIEETSSSIEVRKNLLASSVPFAARAHRPAGAGERPSAAAAC